MSNNLLPLLRDARALGTAIRRAICAAGLTQAEAGALVGVDSRRIRRWIAGGVSLQAVELLLRLEQQGQRGGNGAQGEPATPPPFGRETPDALNVYREAA
jgi:hypothetical protein